jgi:hypothetical protein
MSRFTKREFIDSNDVNFNENGLAYFKTFLENNIRQRQDETQLASLAF